MVKVTNAAAVVNTMIGTPAGGFWLPKKLLVTSTHLLVVHKP